MALGDAAAVLGHDERHMRVGRRWKPKRALEENLPVRGAEQIVAAKNLGHAHGRVVDDHGEHVPGAVRVAGQRDISDSLGDGVALRAAHEIVDGPVAAPPLVL